MPCNNYPTHYISYRRPQQNSWFPEVLFTPWWHRLLISGEHHASWSMDHPVLRMGMRIDIWPWWYRLHCIMHYDNHMLFEIIKQRLWECVFQIKYMFVQHFLLKHVISNKTNYKCFRINNLDGFRSYRPSKT